MDAGGLLSDLAWYALGLGIVALLYGAIYALGRRIRGVPDANDPNPHQRFLAAYNRATDMFGRPMLIGGAGLVVLAVILFVASRFVR